MDSNRRQPRQPSLAKLSGESPPKLHPDFQLMDTKQLIDTLPSYISLYSRSSLSSTPNSNPERSAILKWFSSLSVHHRLSYLTIVDHRFAQILLQMLSKLRLHGHGSFIILPDLPSSSSSSGNVLPSLCFRKSIGLLARVAESNASERLIRDSVRLFNSKEGENISDCSCAADCIDTVTFGEDFVEDADRFVWVMDGVSDSRFLCSDWSEMGGDWVELGWLKERGYYSMEAFVVNRVEVALRLAWLFCNNGKKRGVKLKLKERFRDVGVAANVYWRKKGCFDWWEKLDLAIKRKALQTVLGKSAKSLTGEILRGAGGPQGDEAWLFSKGAEWPLSYNHGVSSMRLGRDAEFGLTMSVGSCSTNPTSLANVINGLLVLQDIVGLILACDHGNFDEERLFFSSLDSVNTIWDCILRKLRGMLMVVSLDSTKLELLEDEEKKVLLNKAKGKVGGANHKKKGKNRNLKKPNPTSRSEVDFTPGKTLKDIESCLDLRKKMDFTESNKMNVAVSEKDAESNLPYIIEGERVRGLVHQNVQAAARKSRKERRKKKSSGGKLDASHEFQRPPSQASKGEQSSQVINCSTVLDVNMPEDNSPGADNHEQRLNSTCNCVAASEEEGNLPNTGADEFLGSEEGSIRSHLKYCQSSDKTMKKEAILLKLEGANHAVDCDGIPSEMIEREAEHVANVKENCANSDIHSNKLEKAFLFPEPNDVKNEILPNHQAENRSVYNGQAPLLSGFPSYEWPSLTPFRFPSANSQHLPPATDRLHLEVGHNWYNHFQRSPMQQMHPFRNTEIEGGRGTILSQPLSVSLEYPPMVRNVNGLSSSITGKYDSGFISRRQYALQQGFPVQSAQFSAVTPEDERKIVDLSDLSNAPEIADEYDSHWVSEEEYELHTMSCIDYNQYFGGGIMYWNPSDYPGAGFSRPPSLSSDDSSWAWCEADMNRTVDDMVAFSSSYSTNGLASPSAAPFYSPFESLGPGHQALGYSRAGNEVTGKLLHTSSTTPDLGVQEDVAADSDAKSGDSLPYPMLRPIIIPNVSRERSRSDFKRSHDRRSPCVPPRRREKPTIKRPPSPVVLCVSHAPRPPPPSPVSDSRKQRGFPTVRSGSSSPRHWGMRGWFHDGNNFDEACVRMDGAEMVWPSWGNKKYSSHQLVQPLPGALLQDRLIAISQLTHDQEHPDVNLPLQPLELPNSPAQEASLSLMHSLLHEEIDCFCKQVAAQNLIRRPYINWAVKRVTRSLQVLWPRSRTNIFGSNATGLSLPTSDVDLVVCLPPVRNLEPIKEAGILEGRNGIKETCLQHAARYLANQEWVQADSLKTVENTTIPIIMLVVEVPDDLICSTASSTLTPNEPSQLTGEEGVCQTSMGGPDNFPLKQSDINDDGKDAKSVRLDISFKSSSHTGLQTTELVKQLTEQFPASVPLALLLKQFLADRSLDQSYSGGLSSYCLVLLIIRFLQHEHHHGRPITQNLGSLFMDFLYFFGNVFDPRQMCVAIQGSGLYINRERGYSIDPIYIDDPLFPTNNVGKNCFRIHQCIKAFADAYSTLANELACFTNDADVNTRPQHQLLQKIIPSIGLS